MDEEGVTRRSLVAAVGGSLALAGCLGSAETAPKNDASDGESNTQFTERYGVELSAPDNVHTWQEVTFIEERPVNVDGTILITNSDSTIELDLTESYTFENPGRYRIEASLAVTDSTETWTDTVQVSYPTPEELSADQFETVLSNTERPTVFFDALTEGGEYTADSSVIFERLGEYASADEDRRIEKLARVLTEYVGAGNKLTSEETAYIELIPASEEGYETALLENGLLPSDSPTLQKIGRADDVRRFEEELYGFDGVLKSGPDNLTHFDDSENPDQMREALFNDFVRMRATMQTGGLSELQRRYLETAATYIEQRQVKPNPQWEQAQEKNLWADGVERRDGTITERDLQMFRETTYTSFSSHDAYPDAVKEHVLGADPTEDVILLRVEHTSQVNTERSRKLFESLIDDMAEEYGINTVGIEGETGAAPIETTGEWNTRMDDRISELSYRGLHHVYFTDGFASAAGIASRGDGANYGLVDMGYEDNDFIEHTIAHELGHMYGLWDGEGNEWVHSECSDCTNGCAMRYEDDRVSSEAADESYMSYCGDDEGSFIKADLAVMRLHQYEQRGMDMGYLDELLARGETLEESAGAENMFWPDSLV